MVTLKEAEQLPLREQDVLDLLRYVQDGGPTYPICLLARKGGGIWAVTGSGPQVFLGQVEVQLLPRVPAKNVLQIPQSPVCRRS